MLALCAVVAASITCGEHGPTAPPAPKLILALASSDSALYVGHLLQLSATVRREDGVVLADSVLTWRSSDSTIARVNADGLVTGLAAGSVTVTASKAAASQGMSLTVLAEPVIAPYAFDSVVVGESADLRSRLRDAIGQTPFADGSTWSS